MATHKAPAKNSSTAKKAPPRKSAVQPAARKPATKSTLIAVDEVGRSQMRALGRVVTDAREVTVSKGLEASIKGDVLTAIQRLTVALARGASILVVDHEDTDLAAELSSQEVADLLNVSRPYVVKLARNGELPHRKVGNRHRFKVADVLAYDQSTERVRDDALREIAPTGGYSAEDF